MICNCLLIMLVYRIICIFAIQYGIKEVVEFAADITAKIRR